MLTGQKKNSVVCFWALGCQAKILMVSWELFQSICSLYIANYNLWPILVINKALESLIHGLDIVVAQQGLCDTNKNRK